MHNANNIFDRIVYGWDERARIYKGSIKQEFNENEKDFLEYLLPFYTHPLYQRLDLQDKSNCLSCGWLIYNEKTIAIESDVVAPACNNIISGVIPGTKKDNIRLAACETLVDEAYHILMVERANQTTRKIRSLSNINIPNFSISKEIAKAFSLCSENWMTPLLSFATATVTEVLISDYLAQLSRSEDIQPLNRMTVAAHLHDELAHSKIFSSLLSQTYHKLSGEQKRFLISSMADAIQWFSDSELILWKDVLKQLKIENYELIINDCLNQKENNTTINYSDFVSVITNNGLLDDDFSHDTFSHLGII